MSGSLFDQVAGLYDKTRPTYPEELFDRLVEQTGLAEVSQLLEIAPGTGQATLPLAKRGCQIVAVELGKRLSTIAKKNLTRYPNVEIINCAFEDVDLPADRFDLAYTATAFHWIRPDRQFSKPYLLLKKDAHLAIIRSDHISSDTGDTLFHATQPIYRVYWPAATGSVQLRALADVTPPAFDDRLFELVEFKCFPQTISYTAKAYCDLLKLALHDAQAAAVRLTMAR